MKTDYAILYGFASGELVRLASCRFLLDAVVLYYLNRNCYCIRYRGKKLRAADIARIAFDNKQYLDEFLCGPHDVMYRIESAINDYVLN